MKHTHELGIFLLEPGPTWTTAGTSAWFYKQAPRNDNRAWHYAQGPP